MRFQDSKFSDLSRIDSDFRGYLDDLGLIFGEDIVENAIILENFLIKYFDLEVDYSIFNFEKNILVRKFIEKLNKWSLKSDSLYKSYQYTDSYIDLKIIFDQIILRSLYDFDSLNDNRYSINIEIDKVVIVNFIQKNLYNFFIFSDNCYKLQLLIEKTIHFDNFLSYILSILNDELHEHYKKDSVIFNLSKKIDCSNLIEDINIKPELNNFNFDWYYGDKYKIHSNLHANYCLKCHERKKDSCRNGLNTGDSSNIDNQYKTNDLDQELHGCPLDQHISEAIKLYEMKKMLGSLAAMMINNPLLVLTGYRICNDCSRSCIFQKQTAVDVPHIETTIFDFVINLRYGVEIYLLLTRWNPLNFDCIFSKKRNRKSVMVAGLGPGGIASSYFLLKAGFDVVAIDGVKIEKIDQNLIDNVIVNFTTKDLENRVISGFGGVMEYGVTSRWNKNYLLIAQLMLERYENFKYYDGIRLGSNYFLEDIFKNDKFDHLVIATGASKQKMPSQFSGIKAKNIRLATDFLMNLQLNGAYKFDEAYLSNSLQFKLPAIVLGGGLTAIDAATEILNYYPRQVLKIDKYVQEIGIEQVKNILNTEELIDLKEFLCHAEMMKKSSTQKELYEYVDSLGGVTILYHKKIQSCNAYKVNHDELNLALAKGVKLIDDAEIEKIDFDGESIKSVVLSNGKHLVLNSLFVACGNDFNLNLFYELGIDEEKILKFIHRLSNDNNIKQYQSSLIDEKISVVGDINPKYKGSVVKAILNGKIAAKEIEEILL